LGGEWLAITEIFQPLPQQKRENVHVRRSIGKRSGTRSSKNSVEWRRAGGAVGEILWAFLIFRLKGRRTRLSKIAVDWRRDGGAVSESGGHF
jgi:hypothetical protein